MTLSEQEQEVLTRLIHQMVETNRLPEIARFRIEHQKDRPVIDRLVQKGLLRRENEFYIPSVEALRASSDAIAKREIANLKKMVDVMVRQYREKPKEIWNPALFIGEIPAIRRLLAILYCNEPSPIKSKQTIDGQGIVSGYDIAESVLDIHLSDEQETLDLSDRKISLNIHDFRGHISVDWNPEGVCLLSGPNGSGKSSLLAAWSFLRDVLTREIPEAIRLVGGAAGFRRRGASGPVSFGLSVGPVQWTLSLNVEGGRVQPVASEQVKVGTRVRASRDSLSEEWAIGTERRRADGRCALRALADISAPPEIEPLLRLVREFRVYASYDLAAIRDASPLDDSDEILHPSGKNLMSVLRNWRAAPRRFEGQFERVLSAVRKAFPDTIEDVEFDTIGKSVAGRFYPPGISSSESLPIHLASDGMLVGLLHMTAVAGARKGTLLAIDEMENQLHPHAIRTLLAAIREIAEERDLTVVLTTHSPVLMNEFKDHTDRFFVLEPGQPVQPVRLDKLRDPDWLAHFMLGDLYDQQAFGSPRLPKDEASEPDDAG